MTLKPTVEDYITLFGLTEAVQHSNVAPPRSPSRSDVVDFVIEFAINMALSEVLSYLGDRYSSEQLSRAIGVPRMVLQIARWNLDQRIEPRDFVRDQYRDVVAQLTAIAAEEAGLWLQSIPEGDSATPDPDPAPSPDPPRSILFGGGINGFGSF